MRDLARLAALLLLVSLLLTPSTSCSKPPDHAARFDRAVEKLFAEGFPQALEAYFCSLGTNPDLGFRWAGTSAERAVGERVAAEMRAMGLDNVRLETVPVDVFEFEHASLKVGDRAMTASTLAGVPPTPSGGVTAPLAYVRAGTAADFDAAGDVAGKIVLIDIRPSSWWFTLPAMEAGHRGAAGIVCTVTPEDAKYFSVDERALGSFDGQYDLGLPPLVYVSRRDGDWLKAQIGSGAVTATLLLTEKITLAKEGGTAYNVVGELPGARGDDQLVVVAAHQDAHFRAGADDTGGLVNLLTIARAMRSSGYRPASTIVFLATTGEEFGYTDAYYDWLTGAWWAVAKAHPDWPGRMRAMINLETQAVRDAPFSLLANPELGPWLEELTAANASLFPHGFEVNVPPSSWNDQWPFAAAGIPTVKLGTYSDSYDTLYHTDFETIDLIAWDYLAGIAKYVFRTVERLDAGVLPLSLEAKAAHLAASVKRDALLAAGADAQTVDRLVAAIDRFSEASGALTRSTRAIPDDSIAAANRELLAIARALTANLTALSPGRDDASVYPHEPLLEDAAGISAALAALGAPQPDAAAALQALSGTYLTRLGIVFSHPVYVRHIARLDPRFARITFAAQGRLPTPLDLVPAYRKVEAGDVAGATADLRARRGELVSELGRRLADMAAVLEAVTPRIAELADRR